MPYSTSEVSPRNLQKLQRLAQIGTNLRALRATDTLTSGTSPNQMLPSRLLHDLHPPPIEPDCQVHRRQRILARRHGLERPAARQRERQHELVGKIWSYKCGCLEIPGHPGCRRFRQPLRWHTELAQSAHHIRDICKRRLERQDHAWPMVARQLRH